MSVQGCMIIFLTFVCLTSAAPSLNSRQKRQAIFFEDELDDQGTPNQGTSNASKVDSWLSRDTRTQNRDAFGTPAFPPVRDAHAFPPDRFGNHYGNWHGGVTEEHGQGGWHTYPQGNWHAGVPQTHGQGNWHAGVPQTHGQGNWHAGVPQTHGQGNWHAGVPQTHSQGNWHAGVPETHGQGNSHGGVPQTHGQGNWHAGVPETHGQSNWHTYPQTHGHYGGIVPQNGFPLGHSPQYHGGLEVSNSLSEYAKGPVDESWIRKKRQTSPTGNNRPPVSGSWSQNQPGWNEVGNGNNGPDWDRPESWLGNTNGGAWDGNNQWSNGNGRGAGTWNGNQNWNGNNGWNGNQRPGGNGNNGAWNGNGGAWNGNNQRPSGSGNNQNSWNNNNGGSWNGNNQRPNGNGNQNSWNNNNGGSWNGNNQRPNGNGNQNSWNNNNGGSWNGNNQRPNGNNQNPWNNKNGGSWNGNNNNNRPTQNAAGDNGNFGNFGNSIAPTPGNNNNRPRPGGNNGNIRPPIAIGGVRPPSTPAPNCDCPATNETNPVCGTDGNTYVNPSRLRCARVCGSDVRQKHYGACTARTTQATNLRRG